MPDIFSHSRFLYYRNQGQIDADRPDLLFVQRATTSNGSQFLHGRGFNNEPLLDYTVGDPFNEGFNPAGIAPAELVTTAAVGAAIARPANSPDMGTFAPTYATLKRRDAGFTIGLLANTWAVLTGGDLGETTLAPSDYTSNTGELVVPASGVYAVSLSVTASRSGLTAPTVDIAVYADGALTDVEEQTGLALAGQPGSIHARAHVQLAAGAVLTPRIRSSLGLTLGVPRWTLAFERVA